MTENKLTEKQEKFAQHFALHRNKTDAYRAAGYKLSDKSDTNHRNAFQIYKNSKVLARIEELIADIEEQGKQDFEWTVEQRRQDLKRIFERGMQSKSDKYNDDLPVDLGAARAAIAEINKMDGDYPPEKLDITDKTPKGLDALYSRFGKKDS